MFFIIIFKMGKKRQGDNEKNQGNNKENGREVIYEEI